MREEPKPLDEAVPNGSPPVWTSRAYAETALEVAPEAGSAAKGSIRRRFLSAGALGLVAAAFLLWPKGAVVPAAGAWDLEIASNSSHTTTALVFGRNAGLHVLSVPSRESGKAPARILANIREGDVWFVGLGRSALQVEARAPAGETMAFTATARVIRTVHGNGMTGVRTN